MNTNKKRNGRLASLLGTACGVILVVMLVACFVAGGMAPEAEAAGSV